MRTTVRITVSSLAAVIPMLVLTPAAWAQG